MTMSHHLEIVADFPNLESNSGTAGKPPLKWAYEGCHINCPALEPRYCDTASHGIREKLRVLHISDFTTPHIEPERC
jgi:hypothetical protein